MYRKQFLCLFTAVCCVLCLVSGAGAAEVDCDTVYCFTKEDFSEDAALTGICITGLPDAQSGTVMLGTRVICVGDILAAEQVEQMTFVPLKTEEDAQAVVTYLPIYDDRVEKSTTMTISIRGKVDQAPVAEDQAIETYKNLPNSAPLKATDPESSQLTYTVTRQPRRGSVEISENGSFTYTPKKNKVGVDSFTYTATDTAGNVSREATVTITVLKPGDATQYSDTTGSDCRFEAEWLKNTGLFVGEQVNGQLVFNEQRTVSRGEFLAMAIELLKIPVDQELTTSVYTEDIPTWLQPYLAAALRSGLTSGLDQDSFGPGDAITGGEAAVLLQNALDLSVSAAAVETLGDTVPEWAAVAVAAMTENGIPVSAETEMNRGQVAVMLYQISLLAADAPGLQMYQ